MSKHFKKIILLFYTILFIYQLFLTQINAESIMQQKEFVPQWAKEVVWYQIFPDRFNNGDRTNDPILESIHGSWPHDSTSAWDLHPWTSDWYKLQPWEKENGKDVWFNIQRRRYGGDLQGIIDKLDYLQDLGVTALYLNPIFESPSLHKYDGATFHHVDPHFGPDPAGDKKLVQSEIPHDPSTWVNTEADKLFFKLVKEVHNRGMRIIIDGVFNHMGLNSWAFQDVKKNQQHSLYKDWFKIISWDDKKSETKFEYSGWFGVRELPELNQDENGIVEGPKKYIFDATKKWMDPNNDGNTADGIDGWRLDVAFLVKHPFWKDWRKHVKSINSEAYLTAEIIDSIEFNTPYLQGDEFDAVMNYNFAFSCADYFIADKTRISTTEFDKQLKTLREAYPGGVEFVMQNLFDSHDTNRLLSHIVNKDLHPYRDWSKYFGKSKGDYKKYKTSAPTGKDFETMKLMILFQMTYLGAPMIYYGDEAGMWGANDPCCRKPMVWEELSFENEKVKPDQTLYEKEYQVTFNKEIFECYKNLIAIRNKSKALKKGTFETFFMDDKKHLYAFKRKFEKEELIIVLNNSNVEQTFSIKGNFRDILNPQEEVKNLEININPKWGRILVAQ